MMNTSSTMTIDMYTAPADVKAIIIPHKEWEDKPTSLLVKVRLERELGVTKQVYVEEGVRKIPRENDEISAENESKDINEEFKKKETDAEDNQAADPSLKKCQSLVDLENSDFFDENIFYVEPEPEFPGPYNPERVRIMYSRACEALKLVPSSRFNHGVNSGRVTAGHQGLGPLGAQAVAMSLLANLTVTELILPYNNMGPAGMRSMAHLIQGNEIIKVLDISDNNLGREGAKILAAAIQDNDSIQQINAAGNKFDDKTGQFFEEAFKVNSSIRQIDFSRNCFCELGAVEFARGMEENITVTHLDLSYNHIRRNGIKGIAKMLAHNRSLMQLDLSWNGIDIDGATQLGQGLNQNISLSVLNLGGCRINVACLLKLLGQMKDNRVLKSLQIPDNPLTNADLTLFLRALDSLPDIALSFIDASSVTVSQDVLDLQKKVSQTRPGFIISYRGLLSIRDYSKNMLEVMDLTGGDPLGVIISYARQKNLRLMDIFARFDTDKSGTMTRQELIMGVADAGIPLSIRQLDKLVAKLDQDGDGEIDFGELLEGYRKFMRDLHKQGKVARVVLKGEQEMFPGLAASNKEPAKDDQKKQNS